MTHPATDADDDTSFSAREPEGRATIDHHGNPVVFADALVLLSGVNFSSVEKVLAAMELIRDFTEQDIADMVEFSDVPLERVVLGEEGHAERAGNTQAFVSHLLSAMVIDEEVTEMLKLRGRFQID